MTAIALPACGEDRSNLIPPDTADSLLAKFDQVDSLAADGQCFEAAKVAVNAQHEIERMGTGVDSRLKRSLLDGVTQLQVFVNDPEKCDESETTAVEPVEPEDPTEGATGTTGTTGTTDTEENATGDQGTTTDEDQDSGQQKQNGQNGTNGSGPSKSKPDPTPTPNPKPDPDQPSVPGSGGVGPG